MKIDENFIREDTMNHTARYFRFLKFLILFFLTSALWIVVVVPVRAMDAHQTEVNDLLQIIVGQSLQLDNLLLDGEITPANLELERFEVFAPDVRIVARDGRGGQEILSRPATAYFKGRIAGAPRSLVVLSADPAGTMRGIAQRDGKLWILAGGVATGGPRLGLSSQEVAQSGRLAGLRPFECGVEGRTRELTPPEPPLPITAPMASLQPGQFYQVPVAIETDGEFYNLFGNSSAAISYIGDLFAYASTIYDRDASARLIVGDVSLWPGGPTSDPWNHTGTYQGLLSFQEYWNANHPNVSRAIAHFLSGRSLGGGIAYLGVLCHNTYGYGYSANLNGLFQIGNPQPVWDIVVVTHEIGHNFDSPHTHCYGGLGGNNNPVDACHAGESGSGCWSGTTSLPGVNALTGGTAGGGQGTLMSYCHLLGGGMANIALTLGKNHIYGVTADRASNRVADYVANVASVYPACITVQGGSESYPLTVTKAGAGSGVVTSDPDGIICGDACTAEFTNGSSVALAASAASGSSFAGWSGCNSTSGATCTVLITASRSVAATFTTGYTLTVNSAGASGVAIGSPTSPTYAGTTDYAVPGIAANTSITLTAPATADNANFSSWSGCNSTSDASCTVLITEHRTVTATYTIPTTPLTNGVPATGLSGTQDSEQYFSLEVPVGATDLQLATSGGTGDADLYVRFAALPTLTDWDCRPWLDGNDETCSFPTPTAGTYYVMLRGWSAYSGVTLVTSYTGGTTYTLNVNSTGATGVAIAADPAAYGGVTHYSHTGIASGASLTLTAPATAGNVAFGNWSGCDSTADRACTVAMTQDRTVTVDYPSDPCPERVLADRTVTGPETYPSCRITAGPAFVVTATGDATFRAGQRIALRPGFRVQVGGRFRAEIDPGLAATPDRITHRIP